MLIKYLIIFVVSFFFASLISPLVIYLCNKLKAKQAILGYVKEHESKNGTPTMGGLIFIFTTVCVGICFLWVDYTLSIISIGTMFCYGLIGFLDDFLKVHYKQNLGLKPYQKIIAQFGLALIIAVF